MIDYGEYALTETAAGREPMPEYEYYNCHVFCDTAESERQDLYCEFPDKDIVLCRFKLSYADSYNGERIPEEIAIYVRYADMDWNCPEDPSILIEAAEANFDIERKNRFPSGNFGSVAEAKLKLSADGWSFENCTDAYIHHRYLGRKLIEAWRLYK